MFLFRLIGLNFLSIYPIIFNCSYECVLLVVFLAIPYQVLISLYHSHTGIELLINYIIVLGTIMATLTCNFVFDWAVFVPTVITLILTINDRGDNYVFTLRIRT